MGLLAIKGMKGCRKKSLTNKYKLIQIALLLSINIMRSEDQRKTNLDSFVHLNRKIIRQPPGEEAMGNQRRIISSTRMEITGKILLRVLNLKNRKNDPCQIP
jgi:hypothetical protein